MSRLVTFGCSFVYGIGLPDTPALDPNQKAPFIYDKPSLFSWSKLLGDKLGRTTINNGLPSAGNKQILQKILNTQFEKDDIVVISWASFIRYDWFYYKSIDDGIYLYPEENPELVLKQKFEDKIWESNNNVSNWLLIHHASCYLQTLNIKQYHFNVGTYNVEPNPFINFTIENLMTITPDLWIVDVGNDHSEKRPGHPGVNSQKVLSDIIYNYIISSS